MSKYVAKLLDQPELNSKLARLNFPEKLRNVADAYDLSAEPGKSIHLVLDAEAARAIADDIEFAIMNNTPARIPDETS